MKPPAGRKEAGLEDRCRAAQIMNNLSDVVSRGPGSQSLAQAEAWARQARGVVDKTRTLPVAGRDPDAMALCEQTLAAVLFNLGALLEVRTAFPLGTSLEEDRADMCRVQMSGKAEEARKAFEESLEQAKRIGMRAGAMEARGALRRLDRARQGGGGQGTGP